MQKLYELEGFFVTLDTPILEAIKLLTSKPYGFQFLLVLDEDNKFTGTLTDGDVRRGLLAGHDMSKKTKQFMHDDPHFFILPSKHSEKFETQFVQKPLYGFLPVLNPDLTVNYVIVEGENKANESCALIMAGGFGRRLGAITSEKPKPLVEVGGIPLIEHILRQLENADIQRIFISVHYLAGMIQDYIKKTGREKSVTILTEDKPLGTAGAISLLPEKIVGNLIVVNCDLINNLDFNDLIQFHSESLADATIAVATHKVQIPFGVVKHNPYGIFERIEEKPSISNYVAAGIYVFSGNYLLKNRFQGYIDMPSFIDSGKKSNSKICVFPLHEEWTDVGRPEELEKMNKFFERKGK